MSTQQIGADEAVMLAAANRLTEKYPHTVTERAAAFWLACRDKTLELQTGGAYIFIKPCVGPGVTDYFETREEAHRWIQETYADWEAHGPRRRAVESYMKAKVDRANKEAVRLANRENYPREVAQQKRAKAVNAGSDDNKLALQAIAHWAAALGIPSALCAVGLPGLALGFGILWIVCFLYLCATNPPPEDPRTDQMAGHRP
jgi:hypothetical protein